MSFLTSRKQTVKAVPYKKEKKNPQERKRNGKRDGKEEKKKKGKERVCASKREEEKGERKGKRENEMGKKRRKKRRENEREGEGEERRGRERRGENRESDTRNVPPSSSSTKLGDNTNPIKGRLGKNTTPTGRRSTGTETESSGGSPAKTTKLQRFISCRFRCTLEKEGDSEYGLHNKGATIYKKAKALGKSHDRFQFSINLH